MESYGHGRWVRAALPLPRQLRTRVAPLPGAAALAESGEVWPASHSGLGLSLLVGKRERPASRAVKSQVG